MKKWTRRKPDKPGRYLCRGPGEPEDCARRVIVREVDGELRAFACDSPGVRVADVSEDWVWRMYRNGILDTNSGTPWITVDRPRLIMSDT